MPKAQFTFRRLLDSLTQHDLVWMLGAHALQQSHRIRVVIDELTITNGDVLAQIALDQFPVHRFVGSHILLHEGAVAVDRKRRLWALTDGALTRSAAIIWQTYFEGNPAP